MGAKSNIPNNSILQLMRKGKKYKLMELVEKSQTTRQYVNYVLNRYMKTGVVKRIGSRKWYQYYISE